MCFDGLTWGNNGVYEAHEVFREGSGDISQSEPVGVVSRKL
jgi:hypothetical protein